MKQIIQKLIVRKTTSNFFVQCGISKFGVNRVISEEIREVEMNNAKDSVSVEPFAPIPAAREIMSTTINTRPTYQPQLVDAISNRYRQVGLLPKSVHLLA